MTQSPNPARLTARRTVVAAVGAGGLAAALAACGDDPGDGGGSGDSGSTEVRPQEGGDDGGAQLGTTSEVPEGGGKIFKDQKVVVTQPEPGAFKAFSAVCTHQGCLVSSVEDGTINCACHGSKFAITDGSVAQGPALEPLPAEDVRVDGDVLRQG
ncbi:Rieske (2Fe-2S) protein [Streptomyces sp. CMB-StM0423]|uniref:Rieske (2Fe-2S) protein n=1 Tax=Streptomyces sp. CMB-StM0423 TaxID=2059884 RepID=UPI000C713168|nr:Rieske (2Fe-2S) protein [Streptomyces sp. CMB-StM0423]AUH44376.1 iron-sulfur protein [Streptomyces sp. CMB-StM0423]